MSDNNGMFGAKMGKRQYWLECLRFLSGIGVVFGHVAGVLVYPSVISRPWWVGDFYVAFIHWCLPVFIMISGALLLSKPIDATESPMVFYKKRFGRLLIPLIFWSFFFIIFRYYVIGPFDLRYAIERFATGRPIYHLWYLYMLVGLYLITPFLSRFIATNSRRWLLWAVIVLLGMGMLDHLVDNIFNDYNGSFLALYPSYVGIYLLGYYLVTRDRPLFSKRIAFAGLIASCLVVAIASGLMLPALGDRAWAIMYANLNPFILLSSVCMFTLFMGLYRENGGEHAFGRRIVTFFAPLTFGIYLVHVFFLETMLVTPLTIWYNSPIKAVAVFTAAIYLLSALVVIVLRLIPGVRRIVI